ncbi:MAG TPA: hypothetical protein VNN09_01010 [Candidatus Competibacteraceae bacterium]|nr:hypothetical protein [Candidatus Competibacteraceae bacterium]
MHTYLLSLLTAGGAARYAAATRLGLAGLTFFAVKGLLWLLLLMALERLG